MIRQANLTVHHYTHAATHSGRDCVPHICGGGGGCAGGDVPLRAVLVLSWCGEVSLGGIQSSDIQTHIERSGQTGARCMFIDGL